MLVVPADVLYGIDELVLDGVGGGRLVSMRASFERSSLFPTRIIVRLGEANARASLRNGCKARNELWDVTS